MRLLEFLAAESRMGIRDAHALNVNLGETTITDLCLLAIARAHIPNIRMASARGRDEPDKGFDWEWFIRYPQSKWLRFSVQAKKLSPRTDTYTSLRHPVGERFQIDLLEDFAKEQGSIPLYAFYNMPPTGHAAAWNCRKTRDEEQYGCTLVPLLGVRAVHDERGRKDFDALHSGPRAFPWRCIACTSLTGRGSGPELDRGLFSALATEGNEVREYADLPAQLRNLNEVPREVSLEGREYWSNLGAYPKRIAVIDLSHEDFC